MPTAIWITAGNVRLKGELADTLSGRTIAGLLPISAVPNVWGDEFYFAVPAVLSLDDTAVLGGAGRNHRILASGKGPCVSFSGRRR